MTEAPFARAPEAAPFRWSMVVESLTRPYPVSVSMIVLVALIPLYVFIPVAAGVILLHTLLESRIRWRRYRAVLEGIQQTQSNLLPDIAQIKDRDPDKIVYKFFKELVSELEWVETE